MPASASEPQGFLAEPDVLTRAVIFADRHLGKGDLTNGIYLDWGKPEQRILIRVTSEELKTYKFPAGSMGPKVDAAIQFVEKTGKRAAIGSLQDIEKIVAGEAGTNVYPA